MKATTARRERCELRAASRPDRTSSERHLAAPRGSGGSFAVSGEDREMAERLFELRPGSSSKLPPPALRPHDLGEDRGGAEVLVQIREREVAVEHAPEAADRGQTRRRRRAGRSYAAIGLDLGDEGVEFLSRHRPQWCHNRRPSSAAACSHSSQRRHEREAHVALAVLAEVGARRHHDAVLEQAARELLRRLCRPEPRSRGRRSPRCRRRAARPCRAPRA